jgi:hypothetical protein
VDRPVAADRDEQGRAVLGGASREVGELTRPLRDQRVAGQAEGGCAA